MIKCFIVERVIFLKKLLITGFEPFGGESVNPSWEAVRLLPDTIGDYEVVKLCVPTVFGKAGETVLSFAERILPDAVICVGQAAGRSAITPELVAINLRYASIPDNDGEKPEDVPVVPSGPDAIFSTLPVRAMAKAVSDAGIRSAVSYSAGTFVCNDLLYSVLYHYRKTSVRASFIHVPLIPEQAKGERPSLPLSDIVKGLEAAISAI